MNELDYSGVKLLPLAWAGLLAPRIPKYEAFKKFAGMTDLISESEFFDMIENMELECYT